MLDFSKQLGKTMKIEVKFLMSESPFRGVCWAVLRERKVVAYCFAEDVAQALAVMLRMQA